MKFSHHTCILFGLLILIACQEDDQDSVSASPLRVETRGHQFLEEGGVRLRGSMSNTQYIQEYGFLISQDTSRFWYGEKSLLSLSSVSREFSLDIVGDLEPGQTYFFTAFARSLRDTAQGEWLSVVASPSPPPVVTHVDPSVGYLRDTIRIVGQNFGVSRDFNKQVVIGEHTAQILQVSDTAIVCIVPEVLASPSPSIEVTIYENSVTGEGLFSLHQPEVHATTPNEGTFRDIIEIRGLHFDKIAENNQVFFGNTPAIVSFSSRDRIIAIVPDALAASEVSVSVKTAYQEAVSPEAFVLASPLIEEVPATGNSRDVMIIRGQHFHPIPSQNKVFIENNEAEILRGFSDYLEVQIPDGPYPSSSASVSVETLDLTATSKNALLIEDPWRMISDSLPFYYYRSPGSFVVNDEAYVMAAQPDNTIQHSLWKFQPDPLHWQQYSIVLDSVDGGRCTGNGTTAYLYRPTTQDNFFQFDPQQQQWVARKDFPGDQRTEPAMFMIGEEVYVGLGQLRIGYYDDVSYSDFYRYNPATDDWVGIDDLRGINNAHQYFPRRMPPTFVIDGTVFLGGGMSGSQGEDWWKYDPAVGSWERIADFYTDIDYASAFVLNNKGYVISGQSWSYECWEYDPPSNTWQRATPVGHTERNGGFSFVVQGIPYAGGGSESYAQLYQLNPLKIK